MLMYTCDICVLNSIFTSYMRVWSSMYLLDVSILYTHTIYLFYTHDYTCDMCIEFNRYIVYVSLVIVDVIYTLNTHISCGFNTYISRVFNRYIVYIYAIYLLNTRDMYVE